MGVTDRIEAFINELIRQQSEEEEWLEIGRNELATVFGCVPSQINYVISTRFSPERGYIVQSKRGGGGCIKIRRVYRDDSVRNVIEKIGMSIDENTARAVVKYLYENGVIDKKTGNIILSATSDASIPLSNPVKNEVRAMILKNTLLAASDE